MKQIKNIVFYSDLPFVTKEGKEFKVGYNGNDAYIFAELPKGLILEEQCNNIITKPELREMSCAAKTKGIQRITLLTDYGLEIHSKEGPKVVGIDKVVRFTI